MKRLVSLFSGVGGFELGFERAGFTTVAQVEIDPQANQVLSRHWPDARRFGDITQVDPLELPECDVITFGSPCQDLSAAGKREGLAGERSGLFHEAIRIIRGRRPRFAVWENVPGAFSSNKGRDFGIVLDALADAGALDICWRVLDARWFGVPQRRRRIFLVADFGGLAAREILFDPKSLRGDTAAGRASGETVAALTSSGVGTCGADDNQGQAGHLIPIEPNGVRRLTPLECERLQGFPDGWTEGTGDSHRYRLIGNAVAVPVAQAIACRMASVLT